MERLNSFLERCISGFFMRGFGGGAEPAEIERMLEREISKRRKKTRRGFILPNVYEISLPEEDYLRLSSARFIEDLHILAQRVIILTESFMDGDLSIRMREEAAMREGAFRISSHYAEPGTSDDKKTAQGTLVLDRSSFVVPLNLPAPRKFASLSVTKGKDPEASVEFGERKIYIGRLGGNELSLTDMNVSRLHAFVEYRRHRHFIHDADSLNGLFVNGEQKKEALLSAGDEILIGSTTLRYDVL